MTVELYRDFRLKIDGDGWLHPGQPLSGSVIVPQRFLNRKTPLKMHVILQGRAEVIQIRDSGRHQSTRRVFAPLLYEVCHLDKPSDGPERRFSFTVPTQVRRIPDIMDLEKLYENPKPKPFTIDWVETWPVHKEGEFQHVFNTAFDQRLPPSLDTAASHMGCDVFACIKYRIAAYVMRLPLEDPTFSYRELLHLKRKKEPTLQPYMVCQRALVVPGATEVTTPDHLDERIHLRETLRCSPREANAEKARMLSLIQSNKDGDMHDLDVDVAIPAVLRPGEPMSIAITMSPVVNANLSLINLKLHQARITITQWTCVQGRASNWAIDLVPQRWSRDVFDLTGDIVTDQLLDWKDSGSGDGRKVQTIVWSAGPLEKEMPGTSKTFNVACYYSLSVALTIECNGRSNRVKKSELVTMAAGQGEALYRGGRITQRDHTASTARDNMINSLGFFVNVARAGF